jgi:subtilisin family serine protease
MRLVGFVLTLALLATSSPDSQALAAHAPDRLLIRVRGGPAISALPAFGRPSSDLGISSVDAVLQTLGAHSVERILPPAPAQGRVLAEALGLDRWCLVRFSDPIDVEGALASVSAASDVEVAELDYRGEGASVTPNDPSFSTQWHLKNLTHPGADNHATDGWTWTTGSASVVVGILDSGGDWDHPDLASRIWSNPGEIPGNGVDDDGNGYIDDIRGWDFVSNDNDPMDDHGHGTNVSGIIGASTNNGAVHSQSVDRNGVWWTGPRAGRCRSAGTGGSIRAHEQAMKC